MPETLHDGIGLFTYFKQKSQKEKSQILFSVILFSS